MSYSFNQSETRARQGHEGGYAGGQESMHCNILLTNARRLSNPGTATIFPHSEDKQRLSLHEVLKEAVDRPEEQSEPGNSEGDSLVLLPTEPAAQISRFSRHLACLGLLTLTTQSGLLARECLVALNTYDGQGVDPSIWVQTVGCLVIGYVIANRVVLERWKVQWRFPSPTYVRHSDPFICQ
jgi:hypothetical protein